MLGAPQPALRKRGRTQVKLLDLYIEYNPEVEALASKNISDEEVELVDWGTLLE